MVNIYSLESDGLHLADGVPMTLHSYGIKYNTGRNGLTIFYGV